jgi:hypothetical protein
LDADSLLAELLVPPPPPPQPTNRVTKRLGIKSRFIISPISYKLIQRLYVRHLSCVIIIDRAKDLSTL